jgi:hypothetical protein
LPRLHPRATRGCSFDPDADEGKAAVFSSIRFDVEGGKKLTARPTGAEPVPWPEDIGTTTLYRAADDRLVVIRAMELYVFAVGAPPHRLTKLCATVKPDLDGEKLNAPASIVVGPMHLLTHRSGRLDVWTGAWGFMQPEIGDIMGGKSVVSCGENEDEFLEIPMVPLFRQRSTSVQGTAGCGEVGC